MFGKLAEDLYIKCQISHEEDQIVADTVRRSQERNES